MGWVARATLAVRRRFRGTRISTLTGINLPDDAPVARLGTCNADDLENAVQMAIMSKGGAGIVVHAADVPRQGALLALMGQTATCGEIVRFSTACRLRSVGFKLDLMGDAPQHIAWLPPGVSVDEAIRRFQDVFDPAIEVTTLLDGNSV